MLCARGKKKVTTTKKKISSLAYKISSNFSVSTFNSIWFHIDQVLTILFILKEHRRKGLSYPSLSSKSAHYIERRNMSTAPFLRCPLNGSFSASMKVRKFWELLLNKNFQHFTFLLFPTAAVKLWNPELY